MELQCNLSQVFLKTKTKLIAITPFSIQQGIFFKTWIEKIKRVLSTKFSS